MTTNLPRIEDAVFDEETIKNAETKEYGTTLLEQWDKLLQLAIEQTTRPMILNYADAFMRQWPQIDYVRLPEYLTARGDLLKQVHDRLLDAYPKDKDELYLENENDWLEHEDLYLDIYIRWHKLSREWFDWWMKLDFEASEKPIYHAAIADISDLMLNPRTGLLQEMSSLANWEPVSDEKATEMQAIIDGDGDD